ncbi:MAG TPA: hypothetical protein VMD30_06410 [Tepidisphaeraceae bacterium]|nr:hypothetical protein [Tepidisphaeraceae bacterium]
MVDPALFRPLCWGLVVLLSFIGWGSLGQRLLYGNSRERHWGPSAATGVGVVLLIAGLLNLLHIGSAPYLRAVIIAGVVAACVWGWAAKIKWPHRSDRVAWVICFIFVSFSYAGTARRPTANPDDCTGYFPLIQDLLQTGTIDNQPFSERRMLSLGGDTALRAMVVMNTSYEYSPLLDPGIALIITAGVMAAIARRWGTYGVIAAAVPIFMVVTPTPAVNATSTYMLVALFCALILVVSDAVSGRFRVGQWVEAGLLAAGVVALKSNAIPAIAIFSLLVIVWLLARRDDRHDAFMAIGVFAVSGAALLLPWMIGMRISCGTWLYPVLGTGFHHGAYSEFNLHTVRWSLLMSGFDTYMRLAVLAVAAWFLFRAWKLGPAAKVVLIFSVAAVLAARLLAVRLGGFMVYRFQFPFLFASMAAAAALLGSCRLPAKMTRVAVPAILTALILSAVVVQIHAPATTLIADLAGLRPVSSDLLAADDTSDGEKVIDLPGLPRLMRQAQDQIPAGQPVLLACAHGYLVDFSRNHCQIADNVGIASPGRQMPLGDASALANYLRARGIRYVLDTAVYTEYIRKVADDPRAFTSIDRDYCDRVAEFQAEFDQLKKMRPVLFNRGGITVVDLGGRAG